MGFRRKSRKRPCRICRKWFYPDPRVGERQKTCGNQDCQDKWHAKKCSEWNNKNTAYFREIYLNKKLAVVKEDTAPAAPSSSSFKTYKNNIFHQTSAKPNQLPRNLIQEVIGVQPLVIIEYVSQLLLKSFQEETRRQLTEIKRELRRLPHNDVSRGDSAQRGP
ncbi:MAG: hypothetical protein JRG71_11460 [Deltaproteobacteria bacterium]|nr:hypothetical protein [Deltaproteobacteria bacterium]